MDEEGTYGVFFKKEAKLDKKQLKEVCDYFCQYGDVKSVRPTITGRVYINFKYASQAERCIEDVENTKYGQVCRGTFVPDSDTCSVVSATDDNGSVKGYGKFKRSYGRGPRSTKKDDSTHQSQMNIQPHQGTSDQDSQEAVKINEENKRDQGSNVKSKGKWSKKNSKKESTPKKQFNKYVSQKEDEVWEDSQPENSHPDRSCGKQTDLSHLRSITPSDIGNRIDIPPLIRASNVQLQDCGETPHSKPAYADIDLPSHTVSSASLLDEEEKYASQVIIGNLSENTSLDDLYEIFEALKPKYISCIRPTNIRMQLLYCIVMFTNPESAQKAVSDFSNSLLHGKRIYINRMDKMREECRQLKLQNAMH